MPCPVDRTRILRCPSCLNLKETGINGEFPSCLICRKEACHDCLSFGYMRSPCPECGLEYPDVDDTL